MKHNEYWRTRFASAMRALGPAIVLVVCYAAAYPSDLRSSQGGNSCPSIFTDMCGSSAACSPVTSPSFIDDLTATLGGYDMLYPNVESCNAGRQGALDAIGDGQAFHVSNWGYCSGGGGAHAGGDGPIFVDGNMSFTEQAKRFWHEGWSRYHECTDLECHDHTIMNADMEGCYGWTH